MGRDDVAFFEPQLLNDHGRRKTSGNSLVNGASPVEEYQNHQKEANSILEPITAGKKSKPQQQKQQDTQQQGCQQREYDHYAGDGCSSSLAVRVPSCTSNWSSTLAVASDEFDGSGGDYNYKQHRRHSVDKESSSPISPQVSVDDHKTCFFYAESCLGSVGSDDYQNELDGSFEAMDSRMVDFFTTPNPTSTFLTIEEENKEGDTITTTTHLDQGVNEEAGRRPLGASAFISPIEATTVEMVEMNNFTQENASTPVSAPTSCSPLHPTAFPSTSSILPVLPQQKRVAVPTKYQGNLNPLPALMPVDPTAKYRKISKTYGSSTSLNVDLVTLFKEHEQYVAALKLAAPKVRPSPFPFIHDLRMQQRRQKKEPTTTHKNTRVSNISDPFGSSAANDYRHKQQRVPAVQPVDFFTPSSSSSSQHHQFGQYLGSHQQPPPHRGGGFF